MSWSEQRMPHARWKYAVGCDRLYRRHESHVHADHTVALSADQDDSGRLHGDGDMQIAFAGLPA